jgi:L-asparaginase
VIHLLFTGGTISMSHDERAGGNVPTYGGEALVGQAPELRRLGPLRVEDWGRYPASHLGLDKLWELRNRVRDLVDAAPGPDDLRGIVITHGTDTMEETAYLLARTMPAGLPIVLTGAMRTASDSGWDGPGNLTDAVRVAAAAGSRGRGVMVVFAGRILAGREAVKLEATTLDAFGAPHGSPLGRVEKGRVEFRAPPASAAVLAPETLTARVALVSMHVGDEGRVLDLARAGSDGVVIVAFGSGNLPPGALPAIRRWLEEGKPVVLATRCARGQVSPMYAFPGGGAMLVQEGVLPAGPRTPSQAWMELTVALSAGSPYGGGTA